VKSLSIASATREDLVDRGAIGSDLLAPGLARDAREQARQLP
jgi:hypothetical protein